MLLRLALLLSIVVFAGCGYAEHSNYKDEIYRSADEEASRPAKADVAGAGVFAPGADGGEARLSDVPPQERKIIYTASVGLVVKDLKRMQQSLEALVKIASGYIDQFRDDSTQGVHRRGHWVVRIPVGEFESFLDKLVDLGVPETQQRDAQDVTEEFVDLEARLANQRRLEKRILDLLENQTAKLSDVIDVESKLSEVRGQIERIEGRLRYLKNKTSLTTITIDAREQKDYEPPQAPTFGNQISSSWNGSIDALNKFGRGLTIASVAVAPWFGVLGVIFVPVAMLMRRRVRRGRAARAQAAPRSKAPGPSQPPSSDT